MKILWKTVAFAAASAVAVSAAQAGDPSEAKEKIRTWYDGVVTKFVACDTSSFGQYSAPGHTSFYPDSGSLNDETSEKSKQDEIAFCENGGKHDLTYEIADVVMLKDTALILGSGHYKRTEPGGAVSVDSDYTFTDVLVKADNGWKFKHTHVGAVLEMPEGGAEDAH